MTKADLKTAWGEYCDTDKLVDEVMALLTKYHHNNTEHGVCMLLNTYFTNKKDLIDLFKTSDSYIGDMRIVLDIELERGLDITGIHRFCDNFMSEVNAKSAIYKYTDEDGKTINDYLMTGIPSFKAADLLTGDIRTRLAQHLAKKNNFIKNGITVKSNKEYYRVSDAVYNFRYNTATTLNVGTVNWLLVNNIKGTYTDGMKTSRAFNRLCHEYKIDTLPEYNKLFAKYSDMVSSLKRKMKFFISLNPLDYLTMSFGNSWASCHTIDQNNERRMPNAYSGAYCGGTLSYMLDGTSIITYVHDKMPESVEEGKIYRNMFHYNNGTLIQGRIYPQGMDGSTDLYNTFRNVIQGELSKMLGLTNTMWTKRRKKCYNTDNTESYGVHYADYLNFEDCNVSYPSEMPDARYGVVKIGHSGICVYCGREMNDGYSDRLKHRDCG